MPPNIRGRRKNNAECVAHRQLRVDTHRRHGVGIAPGLLAHVLIFLPRATVPGSFQGGLGIGLTLVRKLVEKHDGTVTAASAGIGQGSLFTVQLPLLPSVQPAVESIHASLSKSPASLLPRFASWSSMTLSTRPKAWRCYCKWKGMRSKRSTAACKRSNRRKFPAASRPARYRPSRP